MKNIILSVVVIAALATAGIGGTLADFSDIEVSPNNTFSTGALDLVLSDYAGNEYQGNNVPAFVTLGNAWPCCTKDYYVDIHNYGQGDQFTPYVYLHFKNLSYFWVVPKNVYRWVDATGATVAVPNPPAAGTIGTGYPKPLNEPEYVAELGGVAGELEDGTPVTVPGVGLCYGESGQLNQHVDLVIFIAGPYNHDQYSTAESVPSIDWKPLDLSAYDTNGDKVTKMSELICKQLELGQLPNCQKYWMDLRFHLQDVPEEYFNMNFFPGTTSKFNDWPTNALQKDGMKFDMAFELLQNRFVS